jgi:hypothetical protein
LTRDHSSNKDLATFPIVVFSLGFAFFVAQHMQPNAIGTYAHYATAAFMILYAGARVQGHRQAAAAYIFLGGHVFLYSQYGTFCAWLVTCRELSVFLLCFAC